MAALTSLSQLTSGSAVFENFYRQVDPGNTGRVGPTEAALFLKKSGLPDVTLGKIWDLADPDGKGYLDKPGFYVALRLVACAQSGHDVSVSSLNLSVPPPKFKDSNSPSLNASTEAHWAVRPEERNKFDGIFESLSPVNGLLSGEKVRPVLINSKLPLDVLGKVWDLSDIDKDGHLDRDEFAVAMHLVYRALEKEPVPAHLPAALIPPTKRKKSLGSVTGGAPPLPASPPPPKDSLRSTPSHGSMNSLNSAGSLSPKHTLKCAQHPGNWAVPPSDRGRYDDIFLKTDADLDGFVSGLEVKDIFMQSGLSQGVLAHIWALADTRQMGKLTREQFALAMHLIQQKVSKGVDPPQALTADMIPPSERGTPVQSMSGYMTPVGSEMAALSEMRRDSSSSVGSGEFTGIKELDDISQEIAQLQSTLAFTQWNALREKYTLEQDIREAEEAIRHKSTEVQEMQNDLDREAACLQELEAQKQDAQDRLEEMDQQKHKLEDMLNEVRIKCQEESQMISTLQSQIHSQESDLQNQEEELSRAKADLGRLQQEEDQLEQSLAAGKIQLETIIKSLKATQDEINQARSKLSQIQDSQQDVSKSIEQYNSTLNGTHGGSMTNLADMGESFSDRENGAFPSVATTSHPQVAKEDPFKVKPSVFNSQPQELQADPFHSEDPFRTDPFKAFCVAIFLLLIQETLSKTILLPSRQQLLQIRLAATHSKRLTRSRPRLKISLRRPQSWTPSLQRTPSGRAPRYPQSKLVTSRVVTCSPAPTPNLKEQICLALWTHLAVAPSAAAATAALPVSPTSATWPKPETRSKAAPVGCRTTRRPRLRMIRSAGRATRPPCPPRKEFHRGPNPPVVRQRQ
ncbi:epidermal growth factor receptor substrate 15-like 1 isoform X7 [Syngnathus scovelli]|uniref:epidermal growth factor receptor substrate 15-like 1 isoform X7 n=1 Tax=Syngnathus scovelli TaxID=161590 RepID=UPI00210F7D63|nr:epidermal growth factor receptor substrate 15-like 1 isoform X7 [Syngnathus scovelli]